MPYRLSLPHSVTVLAPH